MRNVTHLGNPIGATVINVDWGLVQLQYELFHVSIDDIAEQYETTPRMVEYIAKERNWKRSDLALACQDYSSITTISEDLMVKVKEQQKTLDSLKQSALGPRYIALEAALLGKSLAMLRELSADDPTNAGVLKVVAEILSSLREQNFGKPSQKQTEAPNLQIVIQNRVETTSTEREDITVEVQPLPTESGVQPVLDIKERAHEEAAA